MSLLSRSNPSNLHSIFDDFFAPTSLSEDGFFSPKVDIKDTGKHYVINAELPGVKKEDIHLELHNGVLSLSAETKQEEKEEKEGKVIRQERRFGCIQRSFSLGESVEQSDINAKFEDGLLTITAPKEEPSETKVKKIDIR